VEIAQWLHTPVPDQLDLSKPGQVLGRILEDMDVQYRVSEAGNGYVLPRASETDLLVRQIEGIVSVEADLGTLHVGNAIEALRSNYSDPVGALALKPAEGADELMWVARIPADAANAAYLDYITQMADVQIERWRQIAAGLDPGYPYEHYPGGDETALSSELVEILNESGLPHEDSGEGHRINPGAEVPVYTNEFRGMAYVYAYSGGMPGKDEAEQEQMARELVRRTWELPLGRLSLDKYLDLAWEAQVPVQHLTPEYLKSLVRVGQTEITRIENTYGEIPFNEQ
jgi:hypothetical protein